MEAALPIFPEDLWAVTLSNLLFLDAMRTATVSRKWHALLYPSVATVGSLTRYAHRRNVLREHFLQRLPNLTTLMLDCPIGSELLSITDHCLRGLTRLHTLSLERYKQISDDGLSKLTSLTWLDLRWNKRITLEGIRPLTNLTHLNLHDAENIHYRDLTRIRNLNLISTGSRAGNG
jgi:hypothetical protein